MKRTNSRSAPVLLPACLILLGAGHAFAQATTVEVCLRVDQFQIPGAAAPATGPFGNPAPITMWGFIQTGTGANCTFTAPAPSATLNALPIPTVTAREGDTLIIHLVNNLPPAGTPVYVAPPAVVAGAAYTEPVSVVIPGQPGALVPTWTDGTTGNRASPGQRVRSFAVETPQQNTTPVNYQFGPLKAGTYQIQSGTHPAVQIQMGLYGVLEVLPATAGRAYADASSAFDSEVSLLFSEIDPVLHAAIAAGTFGPGPAAPTATAPAPVLPPTWLTSTIAYLPKYFLVNGKPYTTTSLPTPIGATNTRVLIRFLNAGLDTKVPLLQGQYVAEIAEDGHFLTASGFTGAPPNQVAATCPAPKAVYSVLLPAGKTIDAILTTPASPVSIPVYDRRLHLTNNGASPGGMLTLLTTTAGGGAPPPAPPPACTIVGAVR
jgi:FtsP/CotA-like multicopper oxidase with cupredoxin domain